MVEEEGRHDKTGEQASGNPQAPLTINRCYGWTSYRARTAGLRVYGATLAPYEGAAYYSPQGEAVRTAVNTWMRTSRAFDAVLDFDAVFRDPARPTRLLPAFDSGDRLHPSDAAYEAAAKSVDLSLFK